MSDAAMWISAVSALFSAIFAGLALRSSSRAGRQAERAEAAAKRVTWEIRPGQEYMAFILRNTGELSAFNVEISGAATAEVGTVLPKSEHGFWVDSNPAWNPMITVTWYQTEEMSDPQQAWSGVVPPKP
jgi:hypothetical protein